MRQFQIPTGDKAIDCQGRGNGKASFVFTHGVGGSLESPATADFSQGFATVSPITTFQGNRNLQSRVSMFHAVTAHEQCTGAFGGRSMGSRAAVLAALESPTKPQALVLVSWPLTAGKDGETREPERREQILLHLPQGIDVLFVIGNEDAQCDLRHLAELRRSMKPRTWLLEVNGADHGMTTKHGGHALRLATGSIAAEWLSNRDENKQYCYISWSHESQQVVQEGWR